MTHPSPGRSTITRLKTVFPIMAVLILLAAIYMCSRTSATTSTLTTAGDVTLEDLMTVKLSPELQNQTILIKYTGFNVGFNTSHHIPTYVAWDLTPAETRGSMPRLDKFASDPNVESSATPADYRKSGYSRGHMAPAADMKWSTQAMNDCFLLTNICPQKDELNSGAWKTVEDKCRRWASRDSTLIIICGPVLTDRITRTIGDTHVSVPSRFFKVILAPYANPPQSIGFLMPNSYVEGGAQRAAVSVDMVENVTGLDFFSTLPDSIENQVEAQCNFPRWSALR